MIFEDEKRRSDWIEGRPILLENDQLWEFPLPIVNMTLSLTPGGKSKQVDPTKDDNRNFSRAYWEMQDALRTFVVESAKEGSEVSLVDYTQAILPLAANLLRRNYDLTDDEVLSLIRLKPSDNRNLEMWVAIRNLALAIGPKPEAAG